MTFTFTITPYWLEFTCHVFALICCFTSGGIATSVNYWQSSAEPFIMLFLFVMGIILTTLGAHL